MPEITPLATVKLDKERHLKLNLNSMIRFKEVTGKDMIKDFNLEQLESRDILALLWACLIHEDKTLTMEQVGDLISLQDLPAISEALTKALGSSLPEKKLEESSPNPASRSIG